MHSQCTTYEVLVIQPRASSTLGKHCANRAVSSALSCFYLESKWSSLLKFSLRAGGVTCLPLLSFLLLRVLEAVDATLFEQGKLYKEALMVISFQSSHGLRNVHVQFHVYPWQILYVNMNTYLIWELKMYVDYYVPFRHVCVPPKFHFIWYQRSKMATRVCWFMSYPLNYIMAIIQLSFSLKIVLYSFTGLVSMYIFSVLNTTYYLTFSFLIEINHIKCKDCN